MFVDNTGIKYQPPPPCPANYIPRLEIINEISKVIVDDSSDDDPTVCIGTTVTIRGIGGIGKSTLAKALCYHPPVKKYFTHGFLWISLTPPCLSPEAILRDVYNRLTNDSVTCSYPLLKDRIRLFFSNFPCKLLVIFDDVVDAEDVEEYVEVFSSCKTILTTREKDIDIKIPSKKCFDIGPMKTFEAVQILTWRIPQLATLSANDADKIQELAKDLYYWPLLLSLVRGQLSIHCTAWEQSPTTAILNVREKLQDKGLTAFDPQYIKKDNAVKASINASLELLTNNEKYVLFHVVSGIGIGSCVLKVCVFKISNFSSEEFDKLIKNIWSHGLISVRKIMLPPNAVAHPCIEIHDIIAQYIIEEMPYDYHVFITNNSQHIISFCKHFLSIVNREINVINVKTDAVIMIDVLYIPFIIRLYAVFTRAVQIEFSNTLDYLMETHSDLLKANAVMNFLKRKQPLSQIYGFVKEKCRTMQLLLLDNKYDEAAAWITEYTDNHPLVVLLESIVILNEELTNEFKHNPELVKLINEKFEINILSMDIKDMGNDISTIIYGRKLILEMIEAGATNEEVFEIWKHIQ